MSDQLTQYRRKRDFSKTPEPKGGGRKRGGAALSFVVQKHAARRLHYDFRLEMNGVLKSWAVPKGPSLDPGVKRLAVHVEDHPLDYGGFEGVIPEGQYGGGTVIVWDNGTWVPDGDPEAGYRRGMLKFELRGKRLTGGWALVRMEGRDGGRNWLLVKEKDDVARPGSDDELTQRNRTSVVSGRDMDAVAKARDRIWHSNRGEEPGGETPTNSPSLDPATIAGARKGAMARVPEPQLATLVETVPASAEWLHEIKLDGYRMLARIAQGRAQLFSRNGHDWSDKFPALLSALRALPARQAILDGEVVHLLPKGTSSFSALKDDLSREDTSAAVYFVFDLLYLDGYVLTGARLDARKEALKALLAAPPATIRYSDHVLGRGEDFFKGARDLHLEGIVSKRADAPYRPGRSHAWVKVKCEQREELAVIGWTDPGGSREGIGSLLLGYWDPAGKLCFAGGIGTGFTQKTLKELRRKLNPLAVKEPPSRDIAKAAPRRAHWVEPKLVAELRFAEWTPDGRLRHPSFLGLRDDKTGRDVVREPVAGAATAPADPPAPTVEQVSPRASVEVAGLQLSNAGKVLYPESGITKLELARHYERMGERMLAEIRGRPLTLVRCPEGYQGECFYQKHANATVPRVLRRIPVVEKGKETTYLVADDLPSLIALVQLGVLEIHVWGAREPDIEHPDRVVLDFDPDESLPWSRTVDAAVAMRGLLGEIGLQSFPKTTGGKGLHVVVPLQPRYGWDEIKAFAKSLADEMARRDPAGFTVTMAKKARHGRIFVDYLRNQRSATAIAPYSIRARPNAPVSVPLTWSEVEAGVRSDAFTLRTLPNRLRTLAADPWAEIGTVKQTIPAAVRRKLRAA